MVDSVNKGQVDELPEGIVAARSKISIVWIIPLLAVLIAAWLAFKAWSESGPTITIVFETADGLEEGNLAARAGCLYRQYIHSCLKIDNPVVFDIFC